MREAADELGYRPDTSARQLRLNRTRCIGVVFTMRQPHEVEIVEHMYPLAAERGYTLALGAITSTRSRHAVVEELLNYRSEAIVLIAPGEQDRAILTDIGIRVPVTEVGRRMTGTGFASVYPADDRGAQLAVDHLIGLGHRRIAHLDGGDNPGAAERRDGYRAAMARHGLSDDVTIIAGDYTEQSGLAAADRLAGTETTAVFAANDQSAFGLCAGILRRGQSVPRDLSIVGYDDSPAARTIVQLTTVKQDPADIARAVLDTVIERLDGHRTAAGQVEFRPRLVVRASTAPPKRDQSF